MLELAWTLPLEPFEQSNQAEIIRASNRFAALPCPLGSVLLTPCISTTYPCARLRPPVLGGQRSRLSRWFAFAPATVPPLAPCCAATVATPADGAQAAVRPPGLHRHGASLHPRWLVVPRAPSTHGRCSTTHPVPRASAVAASPPVLAAAAIATLSAAAATTAAAVVAPAAATTAASTTTAALVAAAEAPIVAATAAASVTPGAAVATAVGAVSRPTPPTCSAVKASTTAAVVPVVAAIVPIAAVSAVALRSPVIAPPAVHSPSCKRHVRVGWPRFFLPLPETSFCGTLELPERCFFPLEELARCPQRCLPAEQIPRLFAPPPASAAALPA